MRKAVLYARVSSKKQEEEGFSIPAQINFLHEYAQKNDIEIVKEFVEAKTAKNYLNDKELRAMGQLVSGYLDFSERQAEREQAMTMNDWAAYLDRILTMTGEQLLQGSGNVSHEEAMEHATTEYRKYKQRTISDVERDYLFSIKTI